MFMLEALFIGAFATTAGAGVGVLISWIIDAMQISVPIEAIRAILLSDTINMEVNYPRTIASIIFLTLFTGFSALWPSLRAARMKPVEALTHVE
jgi:ABC-type antimicrobial peptide transport system permease subunit